MRRFWFIGLLAVAGRSFAAIEGDVAGCYAPSYASSVGGEDNAQVILANAVIGNNLLNDQSGTGARMRIVGYYQSVNDPVNWTTTGGMVGWLANNDSRVADVVSFGSSVGADLVFYVVQNSDSGSIAAVAQQPGMYSVYNPGAIWYAVFAHETGGHNYGRSHSDGLLNPKTIMLHNYCGGGAAPPYYYTNPNIWFNNVWLRGDGNNCGQGSLINGGDNSNPSAETAQGVADRRARVLVGPNLNNVVLRWCFTNAPAAAPAGTTNVDLVAGAPAVVRGNGAVYTGTALRIPGGTTGNTAANSIAAYIDLPNGIISSRTNLTIEIWAAPLSAPNWARICDFGRPAQAGDGLGAPGEYTGLPGTPAPGSTQSSDNLMLSATVGTSLGSQRFEARLNGGTAITLDSGLPTTAGLLYHYAITFTDGVGDYGAAGGRWQWYRNGDPIAYLDVNFKPADIEDVNNWLGRSMWSDDAMANNDYAEVRIHSVALSRAELVANYLLGPNYFPTATVTLTNSDALGASSFNAAGNWSNGAAPSGGNSYETFDFSLRTPATSSSYTFGGGSLKMSGGALLFKGTASSTITITNFTLNGGTVHHAGSGVCTLAGDVTVTTNGATVNGVNGAINVAAALNGNGPVTYLANTVTLSGNNSAFTGKTRIGNGAAGTLVIDSEARLGPLPATFTADQLTMNRGTLVTTTTMTFSNSNRGILLDVSGGRFNVAAGTTLTLAGVLSSPAMAGNAVGGSIGKTGSGTLILASTTNSFRGSLFVDSSSTTANDGVVRVVNNQVLANARAIFIQNNNNGASTLQLDGSAGSITLTPPVFVSCRNNSTPTIQNLAGTNTFTGFVRLDVGGNLFNIQSDAGLLVFAGNHQYLGSLTGGRTYNFTGAGNHLVSGAILNSTNGAPISLAKSGSGVLTLSGNNTYAAGTTVNGGTLLVNGSITGTVTVAGGATLGGSGTINGSVTLANGATLSPGSSAGTLTVNGNLTLNNTTTLAFELGAASDRTVVNGNLTLDGVLNVSDAGGFGPGNYTLFSYTGALTDNGLALGTLPGGYNYAVVAGGGAVVLQVTSPLSPFAAWQMQYFGSTNCPACGPAADFDGDGLSNSNEFAAGFNPTNSAAYLRILNVAAAGDDIVVTYLGAAGDTNGSPGPKTNVLEFAVGDGGQYTNVFASAGQTNILNSGSGLGVVTNMTDAGGATNGSARYYRVRVLP